MPAAEVWVERSEARTGKEARCKRARARGKRKVRGRNLWRKGLFY